MSKDKEPKDAKEESKEEPKDPATLAKELEGKLKLNKILLIVAICLFAVVLCVLGAGFGVIYIKVSAVSEAPADKMDEQLAKINLELDSLKTFREEELASVDAFDAKIKNFQNERESTDTATIKLVLLDREKDYQHLVETLRSSTESLAGMVTGSRDWVDFYKGEMETLKQHSIRRGAAIESTLSEERVKKEEAAVTAPVPAVTTTATEEKSTKHPPAKEH